MNSGAIGVRQTRLVEYTLWLGDDALILAQRLGEWVTRAPELEEDVALANIALDLLGQARSLLTYAGQVEGAGRGEDDLAFDRDERHFRNLLLVERPNGDFAVTMARQLAFAAYQYELYDRLRSSADDTLAAIAGKAVKEVAYHRDHATQWVLRLGDGTDESHRRMQDALHTIWPYTAEMFADEPFTTDDGDSLGFAPADPGGDERKAGTVSHGVASGLGPVAVDPAVLREPWLAYVGAVAVEAGLELPEAGHSQRGGRRGVHTEAMGYLLAEMQYLHRSNPGASW